MHPAIQYPRRSQFRPPEVSRSAGRRSAQPLVIVRQAQGTPVECLRVMERLVESGVQACEEVARHAVAVLVGRCARRCMSRGTEDNQREQHSTGPGQQFLHICTSPVRLKPNPTQSVRLKPDTTETVRLKPDTTKTDGTPQLFHLPGRFVKGRRQSQRTEEQRVSDVSRIIGGPTCLRISCSNQR